MDTKKSLVLLHVLLLAWSAAPVRSAPMGPIKTIVLLVMENRSFDHFMGLMKKINPEIDGLTGTEDNPITPGDPKAPRIKVSDMAEFVDPDPGHEFEQIAEQIYGSMERVNLTTATMDGFVAQAESVMPGLSKRVMSAFRPEVVPVTTALAMNFAVFDRWFSSVPSSTQPNRLFVHSTTSNGLLSNNEVILLKGMPQRTIYEDVDDAGLSFGVYYQQIPATLFFRNMRKLKYVKNFNTYDRFKSDAKSGKLPNLVVVEQRYFDVAGTPANDDHPTHDISQGQKLIKEVYETLRVSPQWNQILFLITYDEHGGFYDHVPPPAHGVPSPDGVKGPAPHYFNFNRLGVRVPTIAVSPWIEKGTVEHRPQGPTLTSEYEHSSIAATVRTLFSLPQPHLTAREAWAGNFAHIISRTTPRTDTPVTLPSPPWSLRHSHANESRALSLFQEELLLLAKSLRRKLGMGDTANEKSQDQTSALNIGEANFYIQDAVSSFMRRGKAQLQAGLDPNSQVHP